MRRHSLLPGLWISNIRLIICLILFISGLLVEPALLSAQLRAITDTMQKPAEIGASTIWGEIDGVAVEGKVQSPSSETTSLQVACVFEYTEGDIFNSPPALPAAVNGMVHLDKDLKGLITELRKSGKFTGHLLETLLLTPSSGTIAAKKLLLIGLGDRTKFTPDVIVSVGSVAMREALRLGVTDFAFASDLKDAGIDSPTALIAENVVKGVFDAYDTELYLKKEKMASFKPVTKVTLLAGPTFYVIAGQGIKDAIASFKN